MVLFGEYCHEGDGGGGVKKGVPLAEGAVSTKLRGKWLTVLLTSDHGGL